MSSKITFDYSFTGKFKIGDKVRCISFEGDVEGGSESEVFIVDNYVDRLSPVYPERAVNNSVNNNVGKKAYKLIKLSGQLYYDSFENELELVETKEVEIINDPKFKELFL